MTAVEELRSSQLIRPATAARLSLWLIAAANLAIVETLYFTTPPAQNALTGIGRFLGLHVALIMMLQLLLVARLPWLDRRIGMDRLTTWHRWTGFTLLWTIVAHATFITLGYMQANQVSIPGQLLHFVKSIPELLGISAALTVVVVGAMSIRYARRRLQYETWHTVHLLTYVTIVLVLIHQLLEGSTFTVTLASRTYWWGLWAVVIGCLITGRVIIPLWRNARHQLRVVAVVPESENVVSIYVGGRHLNRLPVRAGQFFVWHFLTPGRFWRSNPFSLSAAPNGHTLRLTAKNVGADSAHLRTIPVGTRVFAEGPYGAFTSIQRTKNATVLIAGGVGITPIRSLLEELTGPVVVLYRVRSVDDAVLLDEMRELAAARGAELILVTGRTGAAHAPNVLLGPEHLRALVPDIDTRDIFVCGPPAMTDAVLTHLRALGIPRAQVHAERFGFAS